MIRRPLWVVLEEHVRRYPEDQERVARFCQFMQERSDCFERSCVPGHITASAWIFSSEGDQFLLTHHRKLGRWLQLGGHADGDPHVERVALREAREESGMTDFDFIEQEGAPLPIDFDIHAIPARFDAPAHLHYDVRFALVARPGQALAVSSESHALRWFSVAQIDELDLDPSLRRVAKRALRLHAARRVAASC